MWDSDDARQHFQRYPVIFLSFKGVKASNWAEMYASIRELISNEFLRHDYLAEPGKLRPIVAKMFQSVLDRDDDLPLCFVALRNLSSLLTAYHGEPTVILIDLELKQVPKGKSVKVPLASAVAQVLERRYTVELEAAGAEPILTYGVVFDGKRAWVRKG